MGIPEEEYGGLRIMANVLDYLAWRGEFSFDVTPWNEIDALLIAVLSYLNFHGMEDAKGWTLEEADRIGLLVKGDSASFEGRKKVFEAMARSVRFRDCRMHHAIAMTNPEKEMQFAALCVDIPDRTVCVAYRGTDNTVVGWKEDFNMAYRTRVPAQEAAAGYLSRAARATERPIRLIGHSKGGNLAMFAAATVPEEIQARIDSIWSFDGPGMNRETSAGEGYQRIKSRIRSFIPQTSIIGLLMDYVNPYTVVRSAASGISQHDPLTWQVYGPGFETLEKVDRTAEVVCETLHEWLQNSTPEQRGAFVETVFQLVDTTRATRISDLLNEKLKSILIMAGNRKDVDPETRRVFNRLMAQAVTLGFGNVMERVRGRRQEDDDPRDAAWETMDAGEKTESGGDGDAGNAGTEA